MNKTLGYWLSLVLILSACSRGADSSPAEIIHYPTPTSHGLFSQEKGDQAVDQEAMELTTTPTVASFFMEHQTPTPQPTKIPTPTVPPSINEFPLTDTFSKTLYADSFNPNWRLDRNNDVRVTIRSAEVPRQGNYSIEVTPKEKQKQIRFIVTPDSSEIYPRELVLGFRFWINPGEDYLEPEDLSVTVLGSNEFPYYVAGDQSVTNSFEPVFSETRLYFLGFNRSVPPYTWAEVIIWLDDLIYDPIYEYVVGFYLKNGPEFIQTYYIDDIQMILIEEELPTRTP